MRRSEGPLEATEARKTEDESLRVLALETLASFNLEAYVLLPFIR